MRGQRHRGFAGNFPETAPVQPGVVLVCCCMSDWRYELCDDTTLAVHGVAASLAVSVCFCVLTGCICVLTEHICVLTYGNFMWLTCPGATVKQAH
jgi:hypothetical protein